MQIKRKLPAPSARLAQLAPDSQHALRLPFVLLLAVFSALVLGGCDKLKAVLPFFNEPAVEGVEAEPEPQAPAAEELAPQEAAAGLRLDDFDVNELAFKTADHAKYLNDELAFAPLAQGALGGAKTALVVSGACRFYAVPRVSSHGDLQSLPEGEEVPLGTVLLLSGEKLKSNDKDDSWDGLFEFEGNYNWFYPCEYEGKTGVVFGADLFIAENAPSGGGAGAAFAAEANETLSLLYRSQGHFAKFYPLCGYTPLSQSVQESLRANRIALQEVDAGEYALNAARGDDMLSLYLNHRQTPFSPQMGENLTPLFVTTDLVARSQHLIFDALLQRAEEGAFAYRLERLCDGYIEKLLQMHTQAFDNAEAIGAKGGDNAEKRIVINSEETIAKALLYFQVARALLDLAPAPSESASSGGGGADAPAAALSAEGRAAVLAKYPQSVREELALIEGAAGAAPSAVFKFADGTQYIEDYSQYKPRSRYAQNARLAAYFKAMTWFGRIDFALAEGGTPEAAANDGAFTEPQVLALRMSPVALLLVALADKDEALYKSWRGLFEPLTALCGKSAGFSIAELLPLWRAQNAPDALGWICDCDNVLQFAKLAREELSPPALGFSFGMASEEAMLSATSSALPAQEAPTGWRLFPQRLDFDSWIFAQTAAAREGSRAMVSGLDVMKAFGSKTAEILQRGEYENSPRLKDALSSLAEYFAARSEKFWTGSYYNMALFELAAQARFEPGTGFYFTETPLWAIKSQLSAHGSWAQLRHGAVLPAQQSVPAEAASEAVAPTFRAEPLPQPVHYLEPNLPFFQSFRIAVELLAKTFGEYALLEGEAAEVLEGLQSFADEALAVCALEAQNQPVSASMLQWIGDIPLELARLVAASRASAASSAGGGEFRMAAVSGVFEDAELGLALESGIGIPQRIYVALNDAQGGKRIAVGYTFSYYEFEQPAGEKLSEGEWRSAVYGGASLEAHKPAWAQNAALPPEGFAD